MAWWLIGLKWVIIAFALAPMVLGLGWSVFAHHVAPRLISKAEIDALAQDLIRDCPEDAEDAASAEELAAWHRGDALEQGKWRRVRAAINCLRSGSRHEAPAAIPFSKA